MSYLSRHRPICAVIQEIRELAEKHDDLKTVELCDEARDYAQRMSARLVQQRMREEMEHLTTWDLILMFWPIALLYGVIWVFVQLGWDFWTK